LLLDLFVNLGAAHGAGSRAHGTAVDGPSSRGLGRIATENQCANQPANRARHGTGGGTTTGALGGIFATGRHQCTDNHQWEKWSSQRQVGHGCGPAALLLVNALIICFLRNKKPGESGFFKKACIKCEYTGRLFDLGFLVHHVLAHNGIKFLDFHLFRHVFLVLGRGVEVAGAS
jgi:hypothetical protein